MQIRKQASWHEANHSDLHYSGTLAFPLLPSVHRQSFSPSGITLLPLPITSDRDHTFGSWKLQLEIHVTWSGHEMSICGPAQNSMIGTVEIHHLKRELFLAKVLEEYFLLIYTSSHSMGFCAMDFVRY